MVPRSGGPPDWPSSILENLQVLGRGMLEQGRGDMTEVTEWETMDNGTEIQNIPSEAQHRGNYLLPASVLKGPDTYISYDFSSEF